MPPLRPAHGRRFPWYALMLYLGLLAALTAGDLLAPRAGLDPVRTLAAMVVLIPVCLAGARALVVVLHWPQFRARPAEILRVDHGGAAMYGGLLPAFLLSLPLLALLRLPVGAFWDVAALAILAGMIPTRFGCLMNGCCAGRRTDGPLGIHLRDAHGEPARRLPTQVFEALLGALLLLLALRLRNELPFPGATALFVVGGYAAGRFLLEGLRERRGPVVAGLGAFQWISLALLAPCALGLAVGWAAGGGTAHLAAAPVAASGAGPVIASGLLLLPVLYLFRFLGCQVVFPLRDPPPLQFLRLGVTVPGPAAEIAAHMNIIIESTGNEIAVSPVELAVMFDLSDGRVALGAMVETGEGSYRVICTVLRNGVDERVGECTGELSAPDQVVLFDAPAGDATGVLNQRLVFEVPGELSLLLGAAVPDVGGSGPFTATMVLESQFGEDAVTTDLPAIGPVGQLQGFQAESSAVEGYYRATCTVSRAGAVARVGQCGGDHDSPGEEASFRALAGDPLSVLNVLRCFEIP